MIKNVPIPILYLLCTYTHAKGNCKIIEIIAFSDDVLNIPVH